MRKIIDKFSFILLTLKVFFKKNYPVLYKYLLFVILPFRFSILKNKFVLKWYPWREKQLYSESTKKKIIFYDLFVSPPTYGDFLLVAMVSRFFTLSEIETTFIIIDGEYRSDWAPLLKCGEEKKFISELVEISKSLNNSNYFNIEILNWDSARQISDEYRNFILFNSLVAQRKGIYNHCFNFLNQIQMDLKKRDFEKTVLSKKNISFAKYENYITLSARYNPRWGTDRNNTLEELISVIQSLKENFSNKKIIIVSDKIGCNYFQKLLKDHLSGELFFSMDNSKNFYDDFCLIVNSDFHFQIRGGGNVWATLLTTNPYIVIVPLGHEIMISNTQLTAWQNPNQFFANGNTLDHLPFWEEKIKRIALQIN